MKRIFLSLLIGAALLAGIPAQAFWQSRGSAYNQTSGSTFVGPGDVVGSAKRAYSLRAYTAAYAASFGLAFTVQRASDNARCDVAFASSGAVGVTTSTCNSSTQGLISPAAFAGTDATASCTLAGTSAVCTGASGTIHVNDPVSGVGIAQPCVVAATNGSTTATLEQPGTTTSCGTVSVAETVTFQVTLTMFQWYDQSGSSLTASQGTTGLQPQYLSTCNGALPCVYFSGTTYLVIADANTYAQPYTYSLVGNRVAGFSTVSVAHYCGGQAFIYWTSSPNTIGINASTQVTGPATDGSWHAAQGIINGASSSVVVDNGTPGTGNAGASTCNGASADIGSAAGGVPPIAYMEETLFYNIAFTSPQIAAMTTNQLAYW